MNYGRPEDYEELERRGVSVRGAIVIARYGAIWRGIKPKFAAEHGAVGCLIYSDPRTTATAMRDGISSRSRCATRTASSAAASWTCCSFPVIRSRPVPQPSRHHAPAARGRADDHQDSGTANFLRRCAAAARSHDRSAAPEGWRGGLPITYRLGPGAAQVHLKVTSNWDTKPMYDVIAQNHRARRIPTNGWSAAIITTRG